MTSERSLGVVVVFTLAVYLTASLGSGLLDDADAGHAVVAKEVLERGDWVIFTMNDIRFLEKAPLLFWSGALSFRVFGVNEFAARLPVALSVLGVALVCWAFGRALAGEIAGLYAGLAAASSWGFFLFTRIFITDIQLTFAIALSLYCYWRALDDTRYAWGFWAGLALAVLSKGLIGAIFPLGAAAMHLLWTRAHPAKLKPFAGAALFLALAAPWHILAWLRDEHWAWLYFVREHFQRFLGTRYPMDYDKVPLLLFWGLNLLWLFPWSAFLPLAFRPWKNEARSPKLLLWLWAGIVLGFFSFSTRQEYYAMPAWPALAILLGVSLATAEQKEAPRLNWMQAIPAALGSLAAVTLLAMLWISRNVTVSGDIAGLLSSNPEMYKLSLGHMFDLQPATFAALRLPAALAAMVLGGGFALCWRLRARGHHFQATQLTAIAAGGFLLCAHLAFIAFEPYLSSRPLARALRERIQPGDAVVFNGEYYVASSIGFALDTKVYLLNGRMTGLEFGSYYPDAPQLFLDDADFLKLWESPRRVYVFTEGPKRAQLEEILPKGTIYEVAASGGKLILSNRRG